MSIRIITKELAGAEDLLLGIGTEDQERSSGTTTITKINADNIPYSATLSIKEKLDELEALLVAPAPA